MVKSVKLQAREKIIEAMRKLPTEKARKKWVAILAPQLYEMQKGGK